MEAFIAQYGIIILIVLGGLYLLTRGRRHLDKVKGDVKDAMLDAALKEMKLDKLPEPQKIAKMAKLVKTVKSGNPEKIAKKAVDMLADKIAALPAKKLPDKVDEKDDIDGLGAALNKAIDSETRREKMKRGLKVAAKVGKTILDII
jgi:hypothetical protein